ncbi:hypothetical protein P3T18_004280 [Paraburkholderia sp. GAS199]
MHTSSRWRSQWATATVATALPIILVVARISAMKRSTPSTMAAPSIGIFAKRWE